MLAKGAYYRFLLPCLSLLFSLALASNFNDSDYRVYTFTLGCASFLSSTVFTFANPKCVSFDRKTLVCILLILLLACIIIFLSPYYVHYRSFSLLIAVALILFVYPLENFSLWSISSLSSHQSFYFRARIFQATFLFLSVLALNDIILLLISYTISAFLLLRFLWKYIPTPQINSSKRINGFSLFSNQIVLSVMIFSQTLLLQLFLSDSLLKYGVLGAQSATVLYNLFQFELLHFFEKRKSLAQYKMYSLVFYILVFVICCAILGNIPIPLLSFSSHLGITLAGTCVFLLVSTSSVLLAFSTVYQKHLLNSSSLLSRKPVYISLFALLILLLIHLIPYNHINGISLNLVSAFLYSIYLFLLAQIIIAPQVIRGD